MPEFDLEGIDLDTFGTRKVVDGQIVWTPPPNADPALVGALKKSVAHANKMAKKGILKFDANGEVQ